MNPETRAQSAAQDANVVLASLMQMQRSATRLASIPSTLSNRELLLAALVVSSVNGSPYHVRFLRSEVCRQGVSRSLVDTLIHFPYWPVSDDDRLDVVVLAASWMAATRSAGHATDPQYRPFAGLADHDVAVLARVVGFVSALNDVAIAMDLR